MASTLDFLKLTDRYELKARLLPALLAVLVGAPGAAAVLSSAQLGWLTNLLTGGGLATVCPVALAYFASAAGRRYERKIWPRWPYDSPTNRWLNPNDATCSQQQKELWYAAIRETTGIDIPRVAAKGDQEELGRVINDAVRALRTFFRGKEGHGLLATHNEDYGFARNLAGMWLVWLPLSISSVVAAWLSYVVEGTGLSWGVMATAILLVCLILLRALPGYVRQRADRYAESFFGMLPRVMSHP
ncbi:MAG: hypothetical protein OXL97_14590 [Chloroflexota bacterium]|nr:hypothetical protein [Chloroflexota bacterium]MDE2885432.1 hypothetical protein [Chloroflexota bacterium]